MEVRLSEAEGFSLTGGASSRQFCLCGGLSESTKFHVVPAVVGEIDIEATVRSIYIFCFIRDPFHVYLNKCEIPFSRLHVNKINNFCFHLNNGRVPGMTK